MREACNVGESSGCVSVGLCRGTYHAAVGAQSARWALTSERDLACEHNESFSKLLLLLAQLTPLCLHTPPWHNEADALPTNIDSLSIVKFRGRLDNAVLAILLSFGSPDVVLVVL